MNYLGFRIRSVADLPEKPKIRDGQTWGPWRLHAKNLTLTHEGADWYEVDLEAMTSSAEMLDIIFQVMHKRWCFAEDAGHLIEALRALLDPQGTLCSFGVDHAFNPTPHLKKLLA